MRGSLLASLAIGCGAILFSVAASALPIKVGLTGAAGQHDATIGPFGDPSYLGLSGWTWDATDSKWVPATMTRAQDTHGNPGLGVCSGTGEGTLDANDGCAATDETNEIDAPSPAGSAPWQMIDMDISQLASNWTGVTITMLSVEGGGEFTLVGSTCAAGDTDCELVTHTLYEYDPNDETSPCSNDEQGDHVWTCNYSESFLTGLGITDIWIEATGARYFCTKGVTRPSTNDDNTTDPASTECKGVLLGSGLDRGFTMDGDPAHVPEPSALGLLGFGTLLMGLLVGLRRRYRVG